MLNNIRFILFATGVVVFVVFLSSCGNNRDDYKTFSSKDGSVSVINPVVRVANKGGNSALYMRLKINSGSVINEDRLISALSPVCGVVELHNVIEEEIEGVKVKKMRPVQSIKVEYEKETVLKPGGMHIMLIGLNRNLSVNDTIGVTLFFEKSGKLIIEAEVENMANSCSNKKNIRPT